MVRSKGKEDLPCSSTHINCDYSFDPQREQDTRKASCPHDKSIDFVEHPKRYGFGDVAIQVATSVHGQVANEREHKRRAHRARRQDCEQRSRLTKTIQTSPAKQMARCDII